MPEQPLDAVQAAQLLEANERLVLALLDTLGDAETAASRLDEVTQTAQRDALTGTPGRALMHDRMTTALGMARRRASRLALMFIDLNHFKQLNDDLGHAAGDGALQAAARLLQSAVRATDTVGRHGGDEFLVLLPEIARAADAALIAQKMLDALARGMPDPDGHRLPLSASIGIAIYPDDGDELADLIARADAAMYSVKREGRHGYRFHVAGMPEAGAAAAAPAPAASLLLREANEHLVVSALQAQDAAADAEQLHRRHIELLRRAARRVREPLAPLRAAVADIDGAHDDPQRLARLQAQMQRHVDELTRRLHELLADVALVRLQAPATAGPEGWPPTTTAGGL